MTKAKGLLELEKDSEYFVWITDGAGFSEKGIHYTVYHGFGGGSLIAREALDDHHPESLKSIRAKAVSLGWKNN